MRKVNEVVEEIKDAEDHDREAILRKYCIDIINECAGSFECTMETVYVPGAENEVQEQPVLVRQTVLDVINKL